MDRKKFIVGLLLASLVGVSLPKESSAAAFTSFIVVRVKDRNVRSVQGATVYLYNSRGKQIATGKTDSSGVCTFRNFIAGNYTVVAIKTNVGRGQASGTLSPGAGPWYANIRLL